MFGSCNISICSSAIKKITKLFIGLMHSMKLLVWNGLFMLHFLEKFRVVCLFPRFFLVKNNAARVRVQNLSAEKRNFRGLVSASSVCGTIIKHYFISLIVRLLSLH